MATASRAESSHNHGESSQLHAIISCAKLRRKKSLFGSIYVEVTADGETRRTAKTHSSSNPKWDERLALNVSPQSEVDFKVWSHHTIKADSLLGKATLNLRQVLDQHERKLENVKEVLKLSVEQKGAAVSTGELTVYLDGLTVADQEAVQPLTNGNTTTTNPTKTQQNGDAIHENGEDLSSSSRAANSTSNGTEAGPANGSSPGSCSAPNGEDTDSVHYPSSLHDPCPVVNGNATTSNLTAACKPLDSDASTTTNGTVNGDGVDAAHPSSTAATEDPPPSSQSHEDPSQNPVPPDPDPAAGSTTPGPAAAAATTTTSSSSSVTAAPAAPSDSSTPTHASTAPAPDPAAGTSPCPAPGEPAPPPGGEGGAVAGGTEDPPADGAKPRQQTTPSSTAAASDALPPG
ncbi:unnamed protein product [Boreogadus saida]